MDNLAKKRHSLAHLLAAAVQVLYPDAKLTLGPAVDNGFYYDIDFAEAISDSDLKSIQKQMKKIANTWSSFEHKILSPEEAREYFKDNKYKLELIDEIQAKGEEISLYTSGNFTDLCRGGHVEDFKEIAMDAWKLDRIAGAYWKGDEKRPMLTRIYGLAFDTKQELDNYLKQQEEAKKRDHRKIGKELDLFTFSELVGPGLPLWTPRGMLVRALLDDLVWSLRKERGYQKVEIPHITKKDLFEKSGHWEKFSDELFKITTREGHVFAMKPMNCPFHTQIFARKMHSYREMPQRYANTTMVYRDEQSGELHGLSRVRSITQDDAHVFCRESQFVDEANKIWDIIEAFYKKTGFGELLVRLSLRDPEKPENYKGSAEQWAHSESQLREIIEKRNSPYIEGIGEAAFYGPKIDFMTKDSIGRTWQVATIQMDRSMPESFDLYCINEEGERERIVMIHAAIMGSIERFMSNLLEHHAGYLPLWLSPVQVAVIPVNHDLHQAYASKVDEALSQAGLRSELWDDKDSLGKKVRRAKNDKLPYWIIVGDEEVNSGTITLESKDEQKKGITVEEFLESVSDDIK